MRALSATLAALCVSGCGARTGLDVRDGALPRGDGGTCTASLNADRMPATACVHGATWLAWQIVPTSTFVARRVSLFTPTGDVALLAASGSPAPGATLARGTLGPPDAAGWSTATLDVPVTLHARTTYFIAERAMYCSTAATGETPPYFGDFHESLDGPWDGPYTSYAWAYRIEGECAPGPAPGPRTP